MGISGQQCAVAADDIAPYTPDVSVLSDAEDTALLIIQETTDKGDDVGSPPSTNADVGAPPPVTSPPPTVPATTENATENATGNATETKKKPLSRKSRIKELEDIKAQLAVKELELMSKENALLEKEQSISVLQAELEIERKLRDLIVKEKEEAEEEALLSKSLCTGSTMLP